MSVQIPEMGLPITRSTQCKVGTHVFVWTGPTSQPPYQTRCDCGLIEWTMEKQLSAADPALTEEAA